MVDDGIEIGVKPDPFGLAWDGDDLVGDILAFLLGALSNVGVNLLALLRIRFSFRVFELPKEFPGTGYKYESGTLTQLHGEEFVGFSSSVSFT